MKRLYIITASTIFLAGCSEEIHDFEIPDDYVAPTHFTDEYGETYVTNGAISTATGEVDGYEYVDLGLSVKWARINVGADAEVYDYGDYYAWGETEPKDEYTSSNSVTYGDDNIEDYSGYKKYDAATANWGKRWRTPTYDEFQELINNCEYEFVKHNGIYGCLFTADNGESIFLPEAGYYQTSSFYDNYFYWTSTPCSSSSNAKAYKIPYSSDEKRYYGGVIRAVTNGDTNSESTTDILDIMDESVEKLYILGLNDDWDEYNNKLLASNLENEWEYQGIAAVKSCSSGYSIYLEKDNDFNTFCSNTGKDDGTIAYQGSENIPFDNTGIFIWTVDLSDFTYNYTEVTTVSYSGFNNKTALTSMTQDSDNPYIYTAQIKITTASTNGGKIVLNGNSNYYVGGYNGKLEYLSTITNDAYLSKGTYTLTVNFLDMTYSFYDGDTDVTCTIDGYEYVDLGLPSGVKWATVNIGATLPADYGNYYAFCETETKSYYSSSNYSFYSVKYNYTDDTEYDAAYVNWSSSWRMPVGSDFSELVYYCYWTWTSQKDSNDKNINGVLITSSINGSSIFFPAAGNIRERTLTNESLVVNYWAYYANWYATDIIYIYEDRVSLLNDDIANENCGSLDDYFVSGKGTSCYGQPVRPVAD